MSFLMLFAGCVGLPRPSGKRTALRDAQRWLCYYGDDRNVLTLDGLDLLVLDADSLGPLTPEDKGDTLCLAYLSVGEANDYRWYWKDIQDAPWVLRENPDWEGDYLVDPRSREWQKLVVEGVAPLLVEAGYDGFMLDTVDTVAMLLHEDSVKYAGVEQGMADLIIRLRKAYPDMIILPNRGWETLPLTQNAVDGLLVESVRSMYDFRRSRSRRLTHDERAWIDNRLNAPALQGLPVFALDYVDPPNPLEAESVFRELQALGYRPLISTLDLMHYTYPYVWTGP